MPFGIVRNDITKMRADAIVNTTNPRPVIGSGVDAGIHRAAGPELLTARERIGRIGIDESAITPGVDLNAKYVIHTVGPVWRGGLRGERKLLRSCHESSLALALENGCESIAFPLISTGNYGFPKGEVLRTALDVIRSFLNEHEMMVSLVVFDRESFQLSRQHFSKIRNNPHYQPTKPTAIALALALALDLKQTQDLIGQAGYALTGSSKFDVIIMYFIREKNYNLFDINAALFEFDQSLLRAQ